MNAAKHTPGLARAHVLAIAEKYGQFEYGDAQGHKRLEFAADVIAARERIRDVSPELLEALTVMSERFTINKPGDYEVWHHARALIAKANGAAA